VSSVVSEASAVRHAHAGQGAHSNPASTPPGDQASPFAALLDDTSDTSLPHTSSPPAAPPPQLPGLKSAFRPQDTHTPEASPETVPSPLKSPSAKSAPATQSGAASPPPGTSSQGNDITQSVLALGLVKAALKDSKPTTDPNADATATDSAATDATAGATALDAAAASSTAAALTDSHGKKTSESDSSSTDTPAPADAAANQANAAPPQTVVIAVVINPTGVPAATADSGSASRGNSGTGQDAAQIAALGDAAKAAGLSRNPGADTGAGGGTPGDSNAPAAANPTAPRIADAAKLIPALTPLPGQKDLTASAGSSQPSPAAESSNGDGTATTQAAIDRARRHAASSQPDEGSATSQPGQSNSPNDNSNVDPNANPNRDPAASAGRIEDITRQALGNTARHGESQTAEFSANGLARIDGAQSGSAPPSPDGSLVAPAALTTAAAPAAAPTTNAIPAAVPIAGLAVEIAAHARAGNNRFEIRLDPPELGRIDVRLDVDRDGKVTSRLVVDRQQTLDMLRRDAPELERSLQQAGLKTDGNALQFSLRDQGSFAGQNPYSNNGSPASAARVIIPDRDLAPVDAAGYGRAFGGSSGLDIRV
jgi:flagellar hook-length control protein FliK